MIVRSDPKDLPVGLKDLTSRDLADRFCLIQRKNFSRIRGSDPMVNHGQVAKESNFGDTKHTPIISS